jgi:hypothetical protein
MKHGQEYYGRIIRGVQFFDSKILLFFEDCVVSIVDQQSCCETRYFHTDYNIADLVGKVLNRIEQKDTVCGKDDGTHGNVIDVIFLEIQAGTECVSFAAYNRHNGYYGSVNIEIKVVAEEDSDG